MRGWTSFCCSLCLYVRMYIETIYVHMVYSLERFWVERKMNIWCCYCVPWWTRAVRWININYYTDGDGTWGVGYAALCVYAADKFLFEEAVPRFCALYVSPWGISCYFCIETQERAMLINKEVFFLIFTIYTYIHSLFREWCCRDFIMLLSCFW